MYYGKDWGTVVCRLRRERRLSQEELADGICSTGTISRIENGSQIPTKSMFHRLLERLGQPGLSYGDFFDRATLEQMRLKRELLEALEYERLEGIEERLCRFRDISEKGDISARQFYGFIRLLYWHMLRDGMSETEEGFLDETVRLLRLTHRGFSPEKGIDHLPLDMTELLLANCAALALADEGRAKQACRLLLGLFSYTEGRHILPMYWKYQAAICNNLAVCEMKLRLYAYAAEHCDRAIGMCSREGGTWFLMKLLRTRMQCAYLDGRQADAREDYRRIRCMRELLLGRWFREVDLEEFLAQKKGLMIF